MNGLNARKVNKTMNVNQQVLTGERALFMSEGMTITNSIFEDGESPLKESKNITLDQSFFKWKYPLWYCTNVEMAGGVLFETARSGIWYTHNISIKDSMIEAPKTFRRSSNITLENVQMPNALESFWNCENIKLKDTVVKGDYFAMNSQDIEVDNLTLYGNYGFDGCSNVVVRNSKLLSKDAFWNCENVTVYDSFIAGEYLAWNTKNLTLINCTIESLQGLCYIENLVMENCDLINTTLAFEYCTLDVQINTKVDSIKNPIEGRIQVKEYGELIQDDDQIDHSNVIIETC